MVISMNKNSKKQVKATKVMKTTKTKKSSIKNNRQRNILIISAIIFAIIGVVFLRNSFAADTWNMVWSDEFDGTSIDTTKWGVYNNTYGDGNKEEACLTPKNIEVSNGTLKIIGKRENITCPGQATQDAFTSGFIATRSIGSSGTSATANGKYFPKYAKYEMRARLPHGQGLWPAFWLRHKNGASTAEVDIMEYFHAELPGKTSATLHLDNLSNVAKKSVAFEAPTTAPAWHTWGVEIQPDATDATKANINFLLDGISYFKVTPSQQAWASLGDVNAMFDIAVNMAIGGNYVGHPDDTLGWSRYIAKCLKPYGAAQPCDATNLERAIFPSIYEVDYVRVFTKATGSTTTTTTTTTTPSTLATPTNLRATPGDKTITLTWDPVAGANNYTVRWSNGTTTVYSNDTGYTNPTTNSYTINGLVNGTAYSLSVAARDSTGASTGSAYSSPITSTPFVATTTPPVPTGDTTPPTKPTGLTATMRYEILKLASVFDLKWTASTDNVGVAKYEIWRDGVKIGESTSTSYTDNNRVKNKRFYTYSIIAKDAAGNASPQANITAKGTCTLTSCTTTIR